MQLFYAEKWKDILLLYKIYIQIRRLKKIRSALSSVRQIAPVEICIILADFRVPRCVIFLLKLGHDKVCT